VTHPAAGPNPREHGHDPAGRREGGREREPYTLFPRLRMSETLNPNLKPYTLFPPLPMSETLNPNPKPSRDCRTWEERVGEGKEDAKLGEGSPPLRSVSGLEDRAGRQHFNSILGDI